MNFGARRRRHKFRGFTLRLASRFNLLPGASGAELPATIRKTLKILSEPLIYDYFSSTNFSFRFAPPVQPKNSFLSVKKWLLRKKHQIELARKRGWKGYWVCLKGTTLLFYPCDSREGRSVEAAPKHLIIVDGAIMQPIPEHPKRDYIFCLSTAFGDAYLFQAPCQVSTGDAF